MGAGLVKVFTLIATASAGGVRFVLGLWLRDFWPVGEVDILRDSFSWIGNVAGGFTSRANVRRGKERRTQF
jgi:hypothetical protein